MSNTRRDFLKGTAAASTVGIMGYIDVDENALQDDEYSLVLGTSGSGTPTEQAGHALSRAMNEHTNIQISVQNTDGWSANLFEYDGGNIPAMGVDNNSLSNAMEGEGPYEDDEIEDLPHQGFIYTNLDIYMVAMEGTGIESTADLREGGYSIYPLQPGAGTRALTEELLKESGIWEENEILNIEFADIAGAVEEGRVDALALYGANGHSLTGWAQEVDVRSGGELYVIETDEEFMQLVDDHDGAQLVEIEPYGWEQDVTEVTDTVGAWQLVGQWAFGSEVPAWVTNEIARVSSEHWETIQQADPTALDHSDPETMTAGVIPDLPIHPGVADFWEEHDVWNDEWTRGEVEEE